jgi:endoglucanase Acf2
MTRRSGLLAVALMIAASHLPAAEPPAPEGVVRVGLGSYTTRLPDGAKQPPATIYKTSAVAGKMPTNDWWSSLAWVPYSERMYPHPLAVQACQSGLRVYYPGPAITANSRAIFGFMPAGSKDDFVIGHSEQTEFPDARVDGFSDWFVSVSFAAQQRHLKLSSGHGSPFVYALYEGGGPQLSFARPPVVWSGSESSPVLGVSIGNKHYGLFGPGGSTWAGLGTATLMNRSEKPYFSVAILPERTEKALTLFRQYAYSHVTDTSVTWNYEPRTSTVTTTFAFTSTAYEGDATGTLFALYPHQWRHSTARLLDYAYGSVRGKMKLGQGASFTTEMRFPGVLPCLPNIGGGDPARLAAYLDEELKPGDPPTKDTYWEGKLLGKLATLAPIAEQYQFEDAAASFTKRLKGRLENWFTATAPDGRMKSSGLFYYNDRWGTLIGYPASYGSDTELNDHNFHYGYFVRAAAEIARRDPAWATADRWGGMVNLLIRDFTSSNRKDAQFPFLRSIDPYAGHSWASGHARFGDGNNNESSSEAMNAWCGLILWGEATGERTVRDLGIWLYTTEMSAINEYWFDVHDENHPASYTPSVVTMIWGGKGANETWFSANPELVHGINWLPIHGGSLYLGHYPAYVQKNYHALVEENKGPQWHQWADIIWMYRALVDPKDALAQFEAREKTFAPEAGNSRANTYHWLHALDTLGQVDPTVTADCPLYAVFRKGDQHTYIVYNAANEPRTVTFSDGFRLASPGRGFASGKGPLR